MPIKSRYHSLQCNGATMQLATEQPKKKTACVYRNIQVKFYKLKLLQEVTCKIMQTVLTLCSQKGRNWAIYFPVLDVRMIVILDSDPSHPPPHLEKWLLCFQAMSEQVSICFCNLQRKEHFPLKCLMGDFPSHTLPTQGVVLTDLLVEDCFLYRSVFI